MISKLQVFTPAIQSSTITKTVIGQTIVELIDTTPLVANQRREWDLRKR